jgi:hypothetical protein
MLAGGMQARRGGAFNFWTSYMLAVVFLAGAGFGEWYVARPSFGANAWGDYLALLAWGFSVEATRATVTDMIRNWGLPGVRA